MILWSRIWHSLVSSLSISQTTLNIKVLVTLNNITNRYKLANTYSDKYFIKRVRIFSHNYHHKEGKMSFSLSHTHTCTSTHKQSRLVMQSKGIERVVCGLPVAVRCPRDFLDRPEPRLAYHMHISQPRPCCINAASVNVEHLINSNPRSRGKAVQSPNPFSEPASSIPAAFQ